ncbi:pimeloyl-ACP methyl ester carboxylesterase [Murinocardiopsis flavida]|uniref:Pimeloyl-ACP methyl ester carboxylesterase n=1 Tax=Murinocardiopsis flavida TaxID=645275 RepID=A0A2P8C8D2_9ACTN|nr:alpha/beta fold hydrolase [Murinocardiopsis flavida]PSK81207.1 pimeloyl-ACP methyl ester carboxylesterase [Murinocardiopsis flavida]
MDPLLPPGARAEYIDLDGGRVRVLRGGTPGAGPPIVLLHGGGTDNAAISWYRLFAPLSADHDVLAFDLPGFGATSGIEPVGGPGAMADFTARVMAASGISGGAVVVGVSMGGDAALNLALRHPASVRALVLIGPGGLVARFRNRAAHTAAWLGTRLPDWVLLPAARLANRFAGAALRAIVHDPATLPDEVVTEFRREALRPHGGIGYARYNQASIGRSEMHNNLLPVVEQITVPTLFFHGVHDPMVPPEGSCAAAALMPDARLVMVPECGHWAQLEAHDRFLSEVADFLGALEPTTKPEPDADPQ